MKAVLISIRPEWCEKIANGRKTIEVRKTRPKIQSPFKCYIYCTKDKPIMGRNLWLNDDGSVRYNAFEKCEEEDFDRYNQDHLFRANGMIIGEFVCDNISLYIYRLYMNRISFSLRVLGGLTFDEFKRYANGRDVYGWHISNLLIYDKPKELNKFIRPGSLRGEELDDHICLYCDLGDKRLDNSCEKTKCSEAYIEYLTYENFVIDRPPQNWCYVEELI